LGLLDIFRDLSFLGPFRPTFGDSDVHLLNNVSLTNTEEDADPQQQYLISWHKQMVDFILKD